MPHSLLNTSQKYIEEKFIDVKKRYILFGNELYEILEKTEPEIFKYLKFYQAIEVNEKTTWGEVQSEDSYAIYDNGEKSFGIQLEPLCAVICLYNEKTGIEIGNWDGNDYYQESIKFIKEELLI